MTINESTSRRDFLASSAKVGAAGTLAATVLTAKPAVGFGGFHRGSDETIRIGVVGCGGRGTGAAIDAVTADSQTKIIAMADMFEDRVEMSLEGLQTEIPNNVDVPEERRFSGFDCYKKLLETEIDMVILATPPHFRPAQLAAAVEANKHVFCEKPVGVDAPGVRSVLKSCELAAEKGLSVVSGLCWRYDVGVNEVMKRIKDGAIGDITSVQVNYLTGELWHRGDDPNWSRMEYQLRNWLYFNWLSGDHAAEQHIHSIDKALWLMDDVPPVACYGSGGRQVRTDPKWGNIYDHFATVFEWEDGRRAFSQCRQIDGCFTDTNDYVFGTTGTAEILGKKKINNAEGEWRFKGKSPSMYEMEHRELMKSIRTSIPINNGKYMSYSTLMALMAREASYTGQRIKWEEYMNSETKLGPDRYEMFDYEPDPVAMPGRSHKTKKQ